MDRHVRILGLLNIAFGVFGILVSTLVLLRLGGFQGVYAAFNEDIIGIVAVILVVFQLLIAAPCIIAGFYVRKLQDWARVMLIMVSAVNVLNFPLGTFLGSYGIWTLMTPETDPLFQNATAVAMDKARKARQARKSARSMSLTEIGEPAKGDKKKKAQGADTSALPSALE
jgi:hypothetical protein